MLTVENSTKFDWKTIGLVDCLEGNAIDTYFTFKVFDRLKDELEKRDLILFYEKILSPVSILSDTIEFDGLIISTEELDNLDIQITEKLNSINAHLHKIVNDDSINFASNKDLTKVLFSLEKNNETGEYDIIDSGLGLYSPQRTEADAPSTEAETLRIIRDHLMGEILNRGLHGEENE